MKSDVIKRRLVQKATYIFPFWVLSLAFWFSSGSVYKVEVCEDFNSTTTICKDYSVSKYTDFKEKSELHDFNQSFILFQIIPINMLCFLPLLGYMYILSSILKADFVKKAFTIIGLILLMSIPLFLIVSISIFPLYLRTSLCKDLKNQFIETNIINFKEISICNKNEEFNYFKGSESVDNEYLTEIKWGIEFQWYFVIASIIFTGAMLISVLTLLLKDSNVVGSGNGIGGEYSLFEMDNSDDYDDDNMNDVIETGLDNWGRNIWFNYTKPNLNLKLLSFIQFIYLLSFFFLFYFGLNYYLIPFFINLITLFICYYFLIFNGMRDNYLIKRMKKENDINQFIEKIKKTKPKVALTKKPSLEEMEIGIEQILEPKQILTWSDNSEFIQIESDKPIIEIKIIEEYKTNNKSLTQKDNSIISLLFVKTDLPNYYITTNRKKSNIGININRGLHAFIVFIGLSGLYKLIYLYRLIDKKTITIKTNFEYK